MQKRQRSTFRRWLRRIWIAGGLLFTGWMAWNLQAQGVPASMFASGASVEVAVESERMIFLPREGVRTLRVAFVFLPGGLVDPDAYVPVVHGLSEAGVSAALVELPYRSALTEGMRATLWQRIRDAHARLGAQLPLVVGGHSRGAALAARFADTHRSQLAGLVLIGTTHPRDEDLSGVSFPVLKIAGTEDCVAPADDARANARNLPPHTQWLDIAGANHAQFGFYGSQINDCRATITREDQQRQLRTALAGFLRSIARTKPGVSGA